VNRVAEVDSLRGAAVAVMIAVHVLAFFAVPGVQTHGAVHVIMELGKLTAVFVVCMGFSAAFSSRRELGPALRRAGGLFLLGHVLNAAKFLVPMFLLGNFPDGLLLDLGLTPGDANNPWFFFLLGDVLHMAGLALAVIALLRHLGARPWHTFALAFAVAAISPLLWGPHAYPLALLASDRWDVFFPLFPWLAYALVGVGLGELCRASQRPPAALYRRWFVAGAVVALAAYLVGLAVPSWWEGRDFYRTGPAAVVCVSGVSAMSFLVAHLLPRPPGVAFLSRNVTRLYVSSWLVITWSVGSIGFQSLRGALPLAALVLSVLAISLGVEWLLTSTVARLRLCQARS
jgi:uncharacterized membrane protein